MTDTIFVARLVAGCWKEDLKVWLLSSFSGGFSFFIRRLVFVCVWVCVAIFFFWLHRYVGRLGAHT